MASVGAGEAGAGNLDAVASAPDLASADDPRITGACARRAPVEGGWLLPPSP